MNNDLRSMFIAAYPNKAEFYDRWTKHRDAQVWDAAIEAVMETDVIHIPGNPYRSNDEE